MNRNTYFSYRRSVRDNGLNYTLEHAPKLDGYKLVKLDLIAHSVDLLAWRVQWINNPDTTRAKIIKLTSPIL